MATDPATGATYAVLSLADVAVPAAAWSWEGSNELRLLPGIRGPLGMHWRDAGSVRIANRTTDTTFSYKTVEVNAALGGWEHDPDAHILAPGDVVDYEAPWDAVHGLNIFDFSTRAAKTGDKNGSAGTQPAPWDGFVKWARDNVWVVVGIALLVVVVLWLTVGGGLSGLVHG